MSLFIFALILAAPAFADDGDLVSIELLDTTSTGKIDVVEITVEYAVETAAEVHFPTSEAAAIAAFTVTDNTTSEEVTIDSITFESGDGAVAVFRLVLDESDANLSYDTSADALDVDYDGSGEELAIRDGSSDNPVSVASFSGVTNDDGAGPAIVSARTLSTTTFEIVFSEEVDFSTIADGNLEFENTETTGYESIAVADLDPASDSDTYVVTVTDEFAVDEATATVRFSGAGVIEDLVGNNNTQTAEVTIADGIAPTVTGLSVDLALVTLSNNEIEVEVTFSEAMDDTVVPVITFSAGGAWDATGPGNWSVGDTVYTRSFEAPVGLEADDVNVTVNAAADAAGNVMSEHIEPDQFDIDTLAPTVLSATTGDVDGNGRIDRIIVVYSEPVVDAGYNAVAVS
ncbi:MAG: hypothetical protein ACMXYM_05765, partial [Candidatus Woesearchaeota archaeon]